MEDFDEMFDMIDSSDRANLLLVQIIDLTFDGDGEALLTEIVGILRRGTETV